MRKVSLRNIFTSTRNFPVPVRICFGQKNRRQGLLEKRIVYTVIGFTRIVCRFRYNP